ncbi:MAG TPA: hypothetical protein VH437_05115 [Terriglobales bacterium]|jgi:hypothetical protein
MAAIALPQAAEAELAAKVSAGMLAGAATNFISSILAQHCRNWMRQDVTPVGCCGNDQHSHLSREVLE